MFCNYGNELIVRCSGIFIIFIYLENKIYVWYAFQLLQLFKRDVCLVETARPRSRATVMTRSAARSVENC